MIQARVLRRRPTHFHLPVILLAVAVVVCAAILFLVSQAEQHRWTRRVSVVVATSPVRIWSWDRSEGTFTVVSVPDTFVTQGVQGYGLYSLDALWKLGFMDRKDGAVLLQSVAEMLGIPVEYYIGESQLLVPADSDPVSQGRALFTLPNAFHVFSAMRTNISPTAFARLAFAVQTTRIDKISVYDLGKDGITFAESEADGSTKHIVDPASVDQILKGVFEDDDIRKENLTVAVYNTTERPSLGTRAARVLTNIGVLVTTVGNDDPEVDRCIVSGGEAALTSVTATTMLHIMSCSAKKTTEGTADLVLRVGTDYARRFETTPSTR